MKVKVIETNGNMLYVRKGTVKGNTLQYGKKKLPVKKVYVKPSRIFGARYYVIVNEGVTDVKAKELAQFFDKELIKEIAKATVREPLSLDKWSMIVLVVVGINVALTGILVAKLMGGI